MVLWFLLVTEVKIRTYNYPQGRVTDHRGGLTLYDLQNIVNRYSKIIDELMLQKILKNLKLTMKLFN